MKVKISIFIALLLITTIIYSQEKSTVYEIPFSSKGNSIELTVANTSTIKTEDVEVRVINKPEWIKFEDENKKIDELKGGEEKPVTFNFSVEKTAPVKETTNLKFKITNKKGESWEKVINIEIGRAHV